MATRPRDDNRLRILLTQECARLMANEGVRDFLAAKRKAAARFGVTNKALLPSNAEIECALADYQRLFKSVDQPSQLRALRAAAIKAMRFLNDFRPRLVGPVLTGTADAHSEVNLHLFADTAEDVVRFLLEHGVPFETSERRVRLGNGDYSHVPLFRFQAGDAHIDLAVFAREAEREAPRSPVDGKPMRRAGLGEVEALLAGAAPKRAGG